MCSGSFPYKHSLQCLQHHGIGSRLELRTKKVIVRVLLPYIHRSSY
uniref:Uncharacterized protein n=1 Tax=Physcomitrium patens TaxID=3218 RepID=A0A2K1KME4_PHYPA|nr:hypothetical protein PHYPA_005834 [Physcomitrium patens]